MDGSDVPPMAKLRQDMYALVLAALGEAGAFGEGLAAVDEAFAVLPTPCHEALWEARVTMMVKGGRGRLVAGEMARLKDSSADLRASVWLALARAAGSKAEALTAFKRALAALASEPLARANVLVEFGEWLFAKGFPARDAEDQLLAAVDALLDLDDEEAGGGEGEVDADEAASAVDGASQAGGLRADARSLAGRSFAGGGGAAGARSLAGAGLGGGRGMAGTLATTLSAVSFSSDAGGGGGGGGGLGVRHFEMLMRIYCMLAHMAPNAAARAELLAVAVSYLARLWTTAAFFASVRESKEIAKAKLKAAANSSEAKKVREMALVPGAHGARVHTVPTDLAEWLLWAPSARFLELMAADRRNRALNGRALKRPAQTLYYLEQMRGALDGDSLLLEQALVLQTAEFIATHLLPASADGAVAGPPLAALALRRRASLCERLGLGAEAAAMRAAAPPPRLGANEVLAARAQGAALARASKGCAALAAGGEAAGRPDEEAADAAAAARLPAVAHVWLELGAELVCEGDWASALAHLSEARAFAADGGDERRVAWCDHHMAALAYQRGEPAAAAALEADAQLRALAAKVPAAFWRASAQALAVYLEAAAAGADEGDALGGVTDAALGVLHRARAALADFAELHPESAVDVRMTAAGLLAAAGRAHAGRAGRTRNAASAAAAAELYRAPPPAGAAALVPTVEALVKEVRACATAAADVGEARGALLGAVEGFAVLGAKVEHAACLLAAADLVASFPQPAAPGGSAGGDGAAAEADAALDGLQESLALAAELGLAAQGVAEQVAFLASTRLTPEPVRTPAERLLGEVALLRARVELKRARLQLALEDVLARTWRADYPPPATAEAAELELAVRQYLTPADRFARDTTSAKQACALGATAARLLEGTPAGARALLAHGTALATLARCGGELDGAWDAPPPPHEEGEGEAAPGDGPQLAPLPLPPLAARAAATLRDARLAARAAGDLEVEGAAALALADVLGKRGGAEEAAAALALAFSCAVAGVARGAWESAAEPQNAERQRHRHRAALRAASRPAAATAARALEGSLFRSSPAFRALRVPPSPLHALLGARSDADVEAAAAGASDDAEAAAEAAAATALLDGGGGGKGGKPGAPAVATGDGVALAAALAAARGRLPPGSGLRVVQLMLSAERDAIYAVAVRASPAEPPAGAPPPAVAQDAPPRVAVCRVPVDQRALGRCLLDAFELRARLEKVRLSRDGPAAPADAGAVDGLEDAAESALATIVAAADALLARALAPLAAVLEPAADELAAAAALADASKQPLLPFRTHLLLCADELLAPLPLEGLAVCTRPHVASVSRDFSFAFVARRLGTLARAKDGGVSRAKVGYCIDPSAEVAEVRARFAQALLAGKEAAVPWVAAAAASKEGGPSWAAQLDGASATPADGDWQAALERSSLFVYAGLSKLLAYAQPAPVAAAALDGLGVALLCDQLFTESSIRRQGKLDNRKGPNRLRHETSYRTALLLAVRGTLCVVLNQWASTAEDNHALLVGTLTALGEGLPVGEAVAVAAGRTELSARPPSPGGDKPGNRGGSTIKPVSAQPKSSGKGSGSRHATLAPDEAAGSAPTRRCSALAPVVYGSPLVRMADIVVADKGDSKGKK
ncbi:hypothetical protein T492DRAFT_1151390 [Pavlovales sp. CCMP2436]|nr:hypothetical protein T492DRAFT_1151390 [Pavlovales sp. CCMP2436]